MRCKVSDCFYNDEEFCSISDIEIDEEGCCSELIIIPHQENEGKNDEYIN